MYKLYVVEIMNSLTINRENIHTDAFTAQEAVDNVRNKLPDGYEVVNVFEETEQVWE